MNEILNRKNYRTFSSQCKGAGVTSIDVVRSESGREVRIRYRARDPRTGKVFQGEWVAPKRDGEAERSEKDFFALAEKDFAVTRRGAEE